jgi:hypothetical protein
LHAAAAVSTLLAVAADQIRVLIVGLPRLLMEMVEEAVREQTGMEVVAANVDVSEFEAAVAETRPEFAIVGLDRDELPGECRDFFDERARVKVLGIGSSEGNAYLYKLRPERSALGEVSPDDVVAAIRAASTG